MVLYTLRQFCFLRTYFLIAMLYLVLIFFGYAFLSTNFLQASGSAVNKLENSMGHPKTIVILGASYAKDWGISSINGWEIINKGISGQETSELQARFEKDVVSLNPDYVIIWGFINDIFRADRKAIDQKTAQTRINITRMVAMAQTNGIRPILATEVTIRHPQSIKESLMRFLYGTILKRPSYQDYINSQVEIINHWLTEFARTEGLHLLDLKSRLADSNGYRIKAFAKPDGSHISLQGYEILTKYSNAELSRILR